DGRALSVDGIEREGRQAARRQGRRGRLAGAALCQGGEGERQAALLHSQRAMDAGRVKLDGHRAIGAAPRRGAYA
ncbi:MAG: hypothetical protein RMJ55_15735, partial [Roseiflexaceae bacterium]|nr:hypothetical protein [Roseiflexaceae bacterium]